MKRDLALTISDTLIEQGISHGLTVGVYDGRLPRERWAVKVSPLLTYSPTDIRALQLVADKHNCGLAYIADSFEFVEAQ